jgi:hypothetical protein
MGAEYVWFNTEEARNQQRTLLEVQVHLLQGLKSLQGYKKARAEELLLKIKVKQKIDALAEQILLLERLLPHTELKLPIHKTAPVPLKETPLSQETTLEDELALIQKKLQALR